MVSRTALICEHYAAECTKTGMKILRPESSEKEKNAPGKARKRRNRVRFGCWRGVQPVRTGGEPRNPNQNAPDSNATHEKRKPAKTQCFRRFCGRGRRTCLACWLGQLAAERHWRSLAPRHAVLEWMWESAAGSGEGLGVTRFPPQAPERPVLVWCCELFLEKDCVSTTTSSFERKAPPPGGWPS